MLDETHDPGLRSWVESANVDGTDFPIQNLPLGRFRPAGSDEPLRTGVAIGDRVLDLRRLDGRGAVGSGFDTALQLLGAGDVNGFMSLGRQVRRDLRRSLSIALRHDSDVRGSVEPCLMRMADVEMALPCRIGDYTDFYTGIHHATAVGKLFRPDAPLLPNYRWVPIGYHGRTSSIGVSGQHFPRPKGQLKGAGDAPVYAPCQRLDYELELGAFVSGGNPLGTTLSMDEAEDQLVGLVLLNDWSARDIQAWEYQPLGPFLAKNFATTVSPWIVTMEALAPFRVPFERPADDPQPLPHLDSRANRAAGSLDIRLEVSLHTAAMRTRGAAPVRLMQSNFRDAYWTLAQLVAHHASNGCNLTSGDLLGTGTQSGANEGEGGSLLELSKGGKTALPLPGGESRTFLEDGDTVILRARCDRAGCAPVGFGECAGTVNSAV